MNFSRKEIIRVRTVDNTSASLAATAFDPPTGAIALLGVTLNIVTAAAEASTARRDMLVQISIRR
jgi:hypothetical protein